VISATLIRDNARWSPQDPLPAKIQDCGKPRPIDDKVWFIRPDQQMGRKYVDGAAEATLDDFAEATQPMAVKGDGLRQNGSGG
jgi:hypothetical protein